MMTSDVRRTGDTTLAADETARLIGSDKVEGTAVYDRDGERIGSIRRVMIDKLGGQAEYAVLTYGGFLGIGENYYPLPWDALDYDERLGGYRVTIDKERLTGGPSYREGEREPRYDEAYGREVFSYYGFAYPIL